nr:MAG TPA: hypothetical protein [Caudoviricetes sp.]
MHITFIGGLAGCGHIIGDCQLAVSKFIRFFLSST